MKEKVEIMIVLSAWGAYVFLVVKGTANVEGFVMLTTYVVKKFLDLVEDEKK